MAELSSQFDRSVTCKNCGKQGLVWAKTKSGSNYLTDSSPTEIRNEGGRVIKSIRPAHRCEDHVKDMEEVKAYGEHLDKKKKDQEDHAAFQERMSTPEGRAAYEQEALEILRRAGRI